MELTRGVGKANTHCVVSLKDMRPEAVTSRTQQAAPSAWEAAAGVKGTKTWNSTLLKQWFCGWSSCFPGAGLWPLTSHHSEKQVGQGSLNLGWSCSQRVFIHPSKAVSSACSLFSLAENCWFGHERLSVWTQNWNKIVFFPSTDTMI